MNGWEEIGQLTVNQSQKNKKDISKKSFLPSINRRQLNYEDYQLMVET